MCLLLEAKLEIFSFLGMGMGEREGLLGWKWKSEPSLFCWGAGTVWSGRWKIWDWTRQIRDRREDCPHLASLGKAESKAQQEASRNDWDFSSTPLWPVAEMESFFFGLSFPSLLPVLFASSSPAYIVLIILSRRGERAVALTACFLWMPLKGLSLARQVAGGGKKCRLIIGKMKGHLSLVCAFVSHTDGSMEGDLGISGWLFVPFLTKDWVGWKGFTMFSTTHRIGYPWSGDSILMGLEVLDLKVP